MPILHLSITLIINISPYVKHASVSNPVASPSLLTCKYLTSRCIYCYEAEYDESIGAS